MGKGRLCYRWKMYDRFTYDCMIGYTTQFTPAVAALGAWMRMIVRREFSRGRS